MPAIATVKTDWGARLILAAELERYLAERTEEPRAPRWRRAGSGRRSTLSPEVVARIRREHVQGSSLTEIAHRLNRDDIATGQGGRAVVAVDCADRSSALGIASDGLGLTHGPAHDTASGLLMKLIRSQSFASISATRELSCSRSAR